MLSGDLEAFVMDHQPHEERTGDAGELTPNGYRLEVACPCGVMFERWVTPREAAEDSPSWRGELTMLLIAVMQRPSSQNVTFGPLNG